MVCVWCDASYDDKTKKCGLGVVIKQLVFGGVKESRIQVKDCAIDNNEAELKAIRLGIMHVDKPLREPIHIVTDSMVAINALKDPEHCPDKYKALVKNIIHCMGGERVRIYHCKGHNQKGNKYSHIQAICDKLAKKAYRD